MINANELRIGNWVKSLIPHGGDFVKFKRFDEDLKIAFFYNELIGAYIEHIQPIPLTPEILEKCGIKGLHTKKLHSIFKLSPIKEGGYSVHVGTIYTTITIQECKIQDIQHLHQLQNLYFALTGEELNYTP